MTNSSVYLEAARQIAQGMHDTEDGTTEGACDVLFCLGYPGSLNRDDLRDEFRSYFVEGEDYYLIDDVCGSPAEAAQIRILTLCFMAQISKG